VLKFVLSIAFVVNSYGAQAEIFTFSQTGFEIPTSGPATPSIIYVEGVTGKVKNISLRLKLMTHLYASETMFAVSNPDGWATLIWDAPQCKFNNSNVLFTDLSPVVFETACRGGVVLPNSEYRTADNAGTRRFTIPIAPLVPLFKTLNELILNDVNGRWILWAEDFVAGDGGRLGGWELIIETEDPDSGDDGESPNASKLEP